MAQKKVFTAQDLVNEIEEMIGKGSLDKAFEYCTDLAEKNPGNFIIYFYLAKISNLMNNEPGCIENLKLAYEVGCDSPAFLLEMGNMFYSLGCIQEARGAFNQGVELFPDASEFLFNVAVTYRDEKNYDKALEYFLKSKEKSDWFEVNFQIASCYYGLKDIDKGVEYIEHAIELDPDNPLGYASLASINEFKGDKDKALELYDKTLSIDKKYCKVYYSIATLKKFNSDDDSKFIEQVEDLIGEESLGDENLSCLNFAIGKYYDDCKDYDKAFNGFVRANFHKANCVDFDENLEDILQRTRGVYNAVFLSNLPSIKVKGPRPIFIVGMPRSGSTLVEQILSSHSKVEAAGEVNYITDIIKETDRNSEAIYPDCMADISDKELKNNAKKYLDLVSKDFKNPSYVTNKMPANYANLGFINHLFEDAIIIHTKRHPLDVCLSTFITDFSEEELSFSCDLKEIAHYYQQYNNMMGYWHENLPLNIYDCYYEELVEKQEEISKGLIDFCDLKWEDSCLDFYKNKNSVYTASKTQVRQKIYKSSKYRWKNYENHLSVVMDYLSDEIAQYDEEIKNRLS